MEHKIVVIGAGVVGLTTALELKRSNLNYDITVVAAHLPGDLDLEYTSPFAGAFWESYAGGDEEKKRIDKPAYRRFLEYAAREPRSGIWEKPCVIYYTEEDLKQANYDSSTFLPWFQEFVDDFRILNRDELPEGIVFGYQYKGVVITTSIYLNFLLSQALEAGIDVRRVKKITDVEEARQLHSSGAPADLVVNCSGLNASKLGGYKDDKRLYPVKGQVLHVRNSCRVLKVVKTFAKYDGETFYIMPRKEGGSIIGGCFLESFKTTAEDPGLTKRIMERAQKYVPELTDPLFQNNPDKIDIIRVNVGLRPFRDGGARVERDHAIPWLIHNYGAGGGGYQGSFGLSAKAVSLASKALQEQSKL